ncbi:MAG: tRNA (adenosine(37)-N6)-threonylcarbamoyltransferase complex dimerization subunit type 1 TsaB [Leptospirales bacterium]|nr:tRNA (adenosine(37)-N6)-threonylcarbamoyltransferase complex dimerization subunit type 1 TsaB [Leptospirales bacterium]
MNTLIFDTASPLEIIVLDAAGRVFVSAVENSGAHSAFLFDNIKKLFLRAGISISDIGLIGVGAGPGSFTGIRVAVSAARALAQALAVPLVGVATHDIYAASVAASDGEAVLVAFDAKKNRVFGSLFLAENASLSVIVPPGDYLIDELLKKCPAGSAAVYAVGDGAGKYREEICGFLKNPQIIANDFMPDGGKISALINKESAKGGSYGDVLPFYARKPYVKAPIG